MEERSKPRLVGINHVALEVADIDEALAFYGRIFSFTLRGRGAGQSFIDMGAQLLALLTRRPQSRDAHRHSGRVVDEIGRASCRDSVCPTLWSSVVSESFQ